MVRKLCARVGKKIVLFVSNYVRYAGIPMHVNHLCLTRVIQYEYLVALSISRGFFLPNLYRPEGDEKRYKPSRVATAETCFLYMVLSCTDTYAYTRHSKQELNLRSPQTLQSSPPQVPLLHLLDPIPESTMLLSASSAPTASFRSLTFSFPSPFL